MKQQHKNTQKNNPTMSPPQQDDTKTRKGIEEMEKDTFTPPQEEKDGRTDEDRKRPNKDQERRTL